MGQGLFELDFSVFFTTFFDDFTWLGLVQNLIGNFVWVRFENVHFSDFNGGRQLTPFYPFRFV